MKEGKEEERQGGREAAEREALRKEGGREGNYEVSGKISIYHHIIMIF